MKPNAKKEIDTVEASKIAGVTTETIRSWIKDFGIGRKVAGRWKVDPERLNKILNGELRYVNQGRPSTRQ